MNKLPLIVFSLTLTVAFILSFLISVSAQSNLPPIYLFGTRSGRSAFYPMELIEYNPQTGEYKNVTSFTWNSISESRLGGGGIYYETGIFYTYYFTNENRVTTNYLLEINTQTGEIITQSNFAEGLITGFCIDQSTGNIHILNFTQPSISGNSLINSGDWWTYNVNTKEYTPVKLNAVQNSNLGLNLYATVFSTATQTLWALYDYSLFGFNENQANQVIPITERAPFVFVNQMAINPKTSEIYIVPYSFGSETYLNTSVIRVDFGSSPNEASFVPVCVGRFQQGDHLSLLSNPFQADIDYSTNTLMTLLRLTTSEQFNGLYTIALDDCTFTQTDITAELFFGFPRFYPPPN